MELERIYALATRVRQRLNCSEQRAEYIASLLAWEHDASENSFELLAEIKAVHSLSNHAGR